MFAFVISNAQITLSTNKRNFYEKGSAKDKYKKTEEVSYYSIFEFKNDYSSFLHITEKMTSMYIITSDLSLDTVLNSKNEQYVVVVFNAMSDAGAKYRVIYDMDYNTIDFYSNYNTCVEFNIKAKFKNEY